MKSLFIRCSQETYDLAHALAKKESRSLNKQVIHMIHNEADAKDVEIEESKDTRVEIVNLKSGLTGLAETKTQD
jgi:hypothetical protein